MRTFWRWWCWLLHRPFWKVGVWSDAGEGTQGRLLCCPCCSKIWTQFR
jgi:hypothetical protein